MSSVHYEPVRNASFDSVREDAGSEDADATELQPLVPNVSTESLPALTARPLLGKLFSKSHLSPAPSGRQSPMLLSPNTPISSDGVFSNLPAKPSSSRDHIDEELGEDEWIFMTPEQRKKLKPPKYSRVKRDRAPRYTTEYTPPQFPATHSFRKKKRDTLKPRVNSLPAGSNAIFLTTVLLCTLLPFLGVLFVYAGHCGRWKTHASRLGARTGMGLGLIHVGAMIIYIPALLPNIFATSSIPLIAFLIWTTMVGLPMGWRLSIHAVKEFKWVQTQERVLRGNLGLVPASSASTDEEDEDIEGGYMYIEGTDIRVRDLPKIIARARDARLARSLRAAGF